MGRLRFSDEGRRRELAAFLRSRRERLTPASAGLPRGQRRLTPGLRREEVASLAGVGATWYTWLEQARKIHPSEHTIRKISRALQLTPAETTYVLDLALERVPRPGGIEVAPPNVMTVVSGIARPAYVTGRWGDVLGYNLAANAVMDLDFLPRHNLLWAFFTPQAKAFVRDWEALARRYLAGFRSRTASLHGHPAFMEFVAELSESNPTFQEWWTERELVEHASVKMTCDHPFVGRLNVEFEPFVIAQAAYAPVNLTMIVSEDDATEARLAELVGQLRKGERSATHNLWAHLEAHRSFAASA